MIRIQEHLDRLDSEAFVDNLAESLWENLNPRLASKKGYRKISLIEKCRKFRKETRLKSYLKRYANNNPAICQRHKDFFDFLLENRFSELKRLIVSRPTEYSNIKADINNILQPNDLFTGAPGNYAQTPFGILLSDNIFNYTRFRASPFCKEIFNKLGFNSTTCPYCNDNKLNIINLKSNSTKATKQKAYLDLDHFYSKSQHPFFAVSFFNLIPSCHDCNSGDKADKLFTIETHIHPYYQGFDSFYKFKISLMALLGDPIDDISIEKNTLKPLDITLDDLNLVDRYNNNFLIAQSLVKYFIDYKHRIGTPEENMFIDAIFNLNGGVPKDKKNILKNQRGKMSRDILKQVDIDNVLKLV